MVVNGDKLLAGGIADPCDGLRDIEKKLQGDYQGLREKYPADYIRNAFFYILDYACDRFKAAWEIHIISGQNDPEDAKQTLHFVKRRRAIK